MRKIKSSDFIKFLSPKILQSLNRKKLLKYYIVHLNFARAYLFTEFIINYINKNHVNRFK